MRNLFYFASSCPELLTEIFIRIDQPLAFMLSHRLFYPISRDPLIRTRWIIYRYGKAHAFFYAIKLGPSFITDKVAEQMLKSKAVLSQYFLQRLHMQIGAFDYELDTLRIANIPGLKVNKGNREVPWGSNIPLSVYMTLIKGGEISHSPLFLNSNDFELFHHYTAGSASISDAAKQILENSNTITDYLKRRVFIPFPRKRGNSNSQKYPAEDGFDRDRQYNLLARVVLVYPEIVQIWDSIGYDEIYKDLAPVVFTGKLMVLFPPTPSENWVVPNKDTIKNNIEQFTNMGFRLNDDIILEILENFQSRLNEIGEVLITPILEIMGNTNQVINRILSRNDLLADSRSFLTRLLGS